MRIDRVPYTEVEKYLKKRDTVLIPLGSCEQQGPHLPMGIETVIVESVANVVGEKAGFAVAPPMPVNYAKLFLDYPGALSVELNTYNTYISDLAEGLAHQGFKHLFFVNIHFGSLPAIESAARGLRAKHSDVFTAHCDCFQQMAEAPVPVDTDNFPYGHGSERTTSMALHLCPERVQMNKVKVWKPKPLSQGFDVAGAARAKLGNSSFGLYIDQADYNPSGATGDPRGATAEKGAAIFEHVVASVAGAATAFTKLKLGRAARSGKKGRK